MPTLDQGTAAADVGPGSARPPRSRSTTFLAIGMLQRLRRRDVDVPGAIDILGTDFCQPSLTIVHTDVEQCRTLVDLVLGPTRPDAPIVIPSQLVVRESTGPVGSGASR